VATLAHGLGQGKSSAVSVLGCNGPLSELRWQQLEGQPLRLLTERSQTLAFEPAQPGTYRFKLSFRDASGTAREDSVSLAVPVSQRPNLLVLRGSHAVREGGKVSVRAWPADAASVQSIRWEQIEGPAVTLDTRDPRLALFTAPAVSRDTLIRLRATLTTRNGATDVDEALVLVEKHAQAAADNPDALWADLHVSRVHPYVAASPHAAHLVPCVYDAAQTDARLCPLSRLPLLAQETGGALPTVEQVMARVLVSHDWMGRNFETLLRQHDGRGDFRRMLMSTTAIVIGAQVRPSFYFAATGAIYLDADNFWLNPDERDTLNEAADYRSGFGSALQFSQLWRYVRDGRSMFSYYDPEERQTRTSDAMLNESASLLYHELGHALDFLPPNAYAGLDASQGVWANIWPRYAQRRIVSDLLSAAHPLSSSEWQGLGQVLFQGKTADATQGAYTPAQLGAAFEADRANDFYAYSTPREDAAMLFEETLLASRLGYQRDVALTDRIQSDATGSSIIVRWGQRGRVGDPRIKPRARLVLEQMAPWLEPGLVDTLPAPKPLRVGESWTATLGAAGAPLKRASAAGLPSKAELVLMRKEAALHDHSGRPKLPGTR